MTNRDVLEFIDRFAPFDTALDFDNCGLLIGSPDTVHGAALLALDVTPAVLDEAVAENIGLIVTHHPVIFHPLKQLDPEALPCRLLRHGIDVISAHTNLDQAAGGVNDTLISLLGLEKLAPLPGSGGCAALCRCPESLALPEKLASHAGSLLSCDRLRLLSGTRPLKTVAVCCGSGGSFLDAVLASGADGYLSGDLKHSHAVAAAAAGITLIDAGHFETETPVLPVLCRRLSEAFPDSRFRIAAANRPLFRAI